MQEITEGVSNISIAADAQKKNRIQVSNTKKPLFFYVNLAKRYMQQHNEVELSALGMAISTVVSIAEILKNNGFAVERSFSLSCFFSYPPTFVGEVEFEWIGVSLERNEENFFYITFHGQIWELEKWEFMCLQSLLLEDLDLVKLKVGREGFKNLQQLSISHCYKLEEIQMEECSRISKIEIVDSNPLIENCIKQFILKTARIPENLSVHSSWKSA